MILPSSNTIDYLTNEVSDMLKNEKLTNNYSFAIEDSEYERFIQDIFPISDKATENIRRNNLISSNNVKVSIMGFPIEIVRMIIH